MRGRKMYVWPTNKRSLMVFVWDLILTLFIVFWVSVLLGMLFGCSLPSATEGMPPVIEGESGDDVELTQDICNEGGGYGCFILVPLPDSPECHFVLVDEVPNIIDELGELGIETNATIEDLRCRGDITDMFLNSCWSVPQSANATWTFADDQTGYFIINDGDDPMVFSATGGRVTIPNTIEHSICQQ